MKQSDRHKRDLIIVGLCMVVVIMAVGFAAFSQQLQINSTSEVTGDWCIGFDNTKTNTLVATPGIQTGTTPTGSMTYGGSTCGTKSQVGVTLASTFKQPGDSIEYTLTILNEGSLDAAINSVLVDNTSVTSDQTITKGNIKYKIEMPLVTSVAAGESTTMKVTASFQNDEDITKSFGGDSASIEVKVNAEQDDGSGGFEVTGRPYTGTIYRNNDTNIYIGASIATVSGTKWVETDGTNDAPIVFNTETECQTDITNNGYEQFGIYCQQKTGTFGGIGEYTTSQSEIQSQHNYYLKHDVVDNIITANYSCFVINNTEYCMKGSTDGSTWAANKALLGTLKDAGTITCGSFDDSIARCSGGGLGYLYAHSYGDADAGASSYVYCNADYSGISRCHE